MSRKANPALIGAFVLAAIALGVVALIIFGGGKFFVQTQKAVLYFTEASIKGLAKGSPVTFRGVKIGQVVDVKVVINPADMSMHRPILIEIEADRISTPSGRHIRFEKGAPGLQLLVERGLRAQLVIQSFVTGQLAVDLDFFPNTPVRLVEVATDYPQLPTVPSSMDKLLHTVENLPIGELVNDMRGAVKGIERVVNDPDVKEILREGAKLVKNTDQKLTMVSASLEDTLRDARKLVQNVDGKVGPLATTIQEAVTKTEANLGETLTDARKLVRDVDARVGPVADDLEKALREAQEVFAKAKVALAGVEVLLEPGSPTAYNLNATLESVTRAADSIRQLTNYLAQNPNALVFGRGRPGENSR
jgi:paraquat-inducible protein B